MFLAIFAGLGERFKALFGRLSLLGRARRLVRMRRELSLSSLERSVCREVGRAEKPSRFLAARFAFFGERFTRPWLTEEKVWGGGTHNSPVGFFWVFGAATLLCGVVPAMPARPEANIVFGLLTLFFSLLSVMAIHNRSTNAKRALDRSFADVNTGQSLTDAESHSVSRAIMQRVEQVLGRMQKEIVGDGTAHARNVARVREHQRRLGQLKVRLERCILDECGQITHFTNADGVEQLDLSGVPDHLRFPWESLVRSMAMAADALAHLDDFEARVKGLFAEAKEPLQARIGRYDVLAVIRAIEAEGVDVRTTALQVRRDIEDATDQLERRIDAIRDSVRIGADCIGDIVAELPYSDRPGARNVGEEIERIVNGLAPSNARVRRSA